MARTYSVLIKRRYYELKLYHLGEGEPFETKVVVNYSVCYYYTNQQ